MVKSQYLKFFMQPFSVSVYRMTALGTKKEQTQNCYNNMQRYLKDTNGMKKDSNFMLAAYMSPSSLTKVKNQNFQFLK